MNKVMKFTIACIAWNILRGRRDLVFNTAQFTAIIVLVSEEKGRFF